MLSGQVSTEGSWISCCRPINDQGISTRSGRFTHHESEEVQSQLTNNCQRKNASKLKLDIRKWKMKFGTHTGILVLHVVLAISSLHERGREVWVLHEGAIFFNVWSTSTCRELAAHTKSRCTICWWKKNTGWNECVFVVRTEWNLPMDVPPLSPHSSAVKHVPSSPALVPWHRLPIKENYQSCDFHIKRFHTHKLSNWTTLKRENRPENIRII